MLHALSLVTTLTVFAVNGLGSSGALSGVGVGEVSDANPVIITPAGYAFSIWGLIYTGLAAFVLLPYVAPACCTRIDDPATRALLVERVLPVFITGNAFNCAWIVTFVFGTKSKAALWFSMVLLLLLVACNMAIVLRGQMWQARRASWLQVLAVDATFSVYAGWTTVAGIANVAIALASTGWEGKPWTGVGWSIVLLIVAAGLAVAQAVRQGDGAYGLAVAWALVAIAKANQGKHDDVAGVALAAAAVAGVSGLVAIGMYVRRRCSAGDAGEGTGDKQAGFDGASDGSQHVDGDYGRAHV